MKRIFLIVFLGLILGVSPAIAQDDVSLFDYWKYYSDIENAQYKYFCSVALDQLSQREKHISTLSTKEDWLNRQELVREKLKKLIGPFPEKTSLNAHVTGVLKRDGYRVEKLIYESQPGYYVTAALFIPDKISGKAPAILNAIGHSTQSFRRDIYQHVIINLVKKGFVVLTYDQMGQGERIQYFDKETGKSRFGSTTQHSYPGAQCFISGYSPANYFIWDGIRGIDYLLTRKEVDPDRIGMTGLSGGGTSTAFTAAIDDRILAAAPTCFITKYEYLFKSIGPQDAEQNIYHLLYEGLDHADFVELRAPKPTLLVTTTRDFFSIQGARETFYEAKQAYFAFGKEDLLQMSEGDHVHGFIKKNNEATYAFFQKYLNNPGDSTDENVETIPEKELLVTETGQVATSMTAETMFSLNKKKVEKQEKILETARLDSERHLAQVHETAKRISGFEHPGQFGSPVFSGRYVKTDYVLEKYLIPGSGDYMLPAALFMPIKNKKSEIILLLDEDGMDHAANQDSLAHQLIAQGYSVLLFDVPGVGSMGPGYLKGDAYIDKVSYNQWFAGILTGKSIVGLRAEDIVRMVHFVKQEYGEFKTVSAISRGVTDSDLLHAAVFSRDIENIALINPLMSYTDIALTRDYKPSFILDVVPGSIEEYDLPDLMAALDGRKLMLIDPLRASGNIAKEVEYQKILAFPIHVYSEKQISSDFRIALQTGEEVPWSLWEWWLK